MRYCSNCGAIEEFDLNTSNPDEYTGRICRDCKEHDTDTPVPDFLKDEIRRIFSLEFEPKRVNGQIVARYLTSDVHLRQDPETKQYSIYYHPQEVPVVPMPTVRTD